MARGTEHEQHAGDAEGWQVAIDESTHHAQQGVAQSDRRTLDSYRA